MPPSEQEPTSLVEWLKSLPPEEFQGALAFISYRSILRLIPLVALEWQKSADSTEILKTLFLSAVTTRVIPYHQSSWSIHNLELATYEASSLTDIDFIKTSRIIHDVLSWTSTVTGNLFFSLGAVVKDDMFDRLKVFENPFNHPHLSFRTLSGLSISHHDLYALARDKVCWQNPELKNPFSSPLWLEGIDPGGWSYLHGEFKSLLTQFDPEEHWQVWLDWYEAAISGKPLVETLSESVELDERLAAGDNRKDFWQRPAAEINRDFASWVKELQHKAEDQPAQIVAPQKPIFISYAHPNEAEARKIGALIEELGYPVFAQYKDILPGNNFVEEMQQGLAEMGCLVPLYSPAYIASNHCAAEWNAAYNLDPVGKRRLIRGVLLAPTELKPLQRQVIYQPLYGLTPEQARRAIRDLLSDKPKTPAQSRSDAYEFASPLPGINDHNVLDISSSPEVAQPFLDDELHRLPEDQRRCVNALRHALRERNAAPLIARSLESYEQDIEAGQLSKSLTSFSREVAIIQAEIKDNPDAPWYSGGIKILFGQFFQTHEALCQHFPILIYREILVDKAAIDPSRFDQSEFIHHNEALKRASAALHHESKASASFLKYIEKQERQRRDISDFTALVPQTTDRLINAASEQDADQIKKSFLFDRSGFLDRLLDRTEKTASLADSASVQLLIKTAKDILNAIWS